LAAGRGGAETQVGHIDNYARNRDHERRKSIRRPSRKRVWADPGGVAPVVDCMIVDISEEGASLAVVRGGHLPDVFQLQSDSSTPLGQAEVVWRRDNTVGVKLAKTRKP
jgi:hypothetical protein